MLVRIIRTGPGCVFQPGQLVRMTDKRAKTLITYGYAVPPDKVVDIEAMRSSSEHHPKVGEDITSIVIPVYNQASYLDKCLASVKKYTKNYEVIIVDNGSDSDTKEVIHRYHTKVITNKENMGFPHAVNQGILNSRGKRICLLNSDTIVTPDWLKKMERVLRPPYGMAGPTTNYSTGPQCDRSIEGRDFRFRQAGKGKDYSEAEICGLANRFEGRREVDKLSGFCLLIDRRVISEIGAFDESFGLGSAEEMDFEDRAKRKNWKLVWARDSYVHHHGHKTLLEIYGNKVQEKGLANHRKFEQMVKDRDKGRRDVVVPFFKGVPLLFPTWGRLGYTQKTLPLLLERTPKAQVVMIDDGSEDGTQFFLESFRDERIVSRIYRPSRLGIDKNMDLFFSLTAGCEYLAKIDNDVIMPEGWLEELIRVLEISGVDVIAPTHFSNREAVKKYLNQRNKIEDVYLNYHVGGLVVIKGSWLQDVLSDGGTCYWERYGETPGGWTHLQETTGGKKAFYPKVKAKLLDSKRGPGEDYPKYNRKLHQERVKKYKRVPERQ